MARLVIFDDKVRGVQLPERQVMIGRSKKTDIPINDGLLSRKHCSIVPAAGGFRLLDLKSSNGTYLNGERIEKVDLSIDDIIEIGHTVIVYLDEGVWSRGEGLASLRNPLKAQELIGRIKHHHRSTDKAEKIPIVAVGPPSKPRKKLERRKVRGTPQPAVHVNPVSFQDLAEALEEFIGNRAALLITRESPELGKIVTEVLDEVLGPAAAATRGEPGELRAQIRASVRARLRNLAGASSTPRKGIGAEEPGEPRNGGNS